MRQEGEETVRGRGRGEGDVVLGVVVVGGDDECDSGRRKSGMRDRVRGHSEKTKRKEKELNGGGSKREGKGREKEG